MKRAGLLTAVLATAVLGPGALQVQAADEVILRSSTEPAEAWIGQRVRLNIEVLGADGWAQIPEMGRVEIPGAYVMQTESQGVRLSETINRTTYTGQRYQLSIYCQRPGRLEVPAMPVTVVLKQWGVNAAETSYERLTPAASLQCKVPPGAEGIRGLISTTRLEADQSWSSRPDSAVTGDAITRTVTMSADDVSGMAFPPVRYPEIEGVGLYPGQPSVSDESNRGALRGRREESVTYVFEQPGEVELPAITLSWWDVASRRLRRIELPGLELTVEGELAPEPTAEPEAVVVEQPRNRLVLAAEVAMLIVIGLWFGMWLGRWYQVRRKAWLASEEYAFREMKRALRTRDAGKISAAVMRWLDRLETDNRPARLDEFLRRHGDEATRAAATELARVLATDETFSAAPDLKLGLKRARRNHLRSRRAHRKADAILPDLNRRLRP